ncbi:MAG: hypothetical protein WA777_05640, partial [Rhodanobacter sp.]
DADIQNLSSRLQIAPPQTSVLASDALGYTPSSAQQIATLVRNAPAQPITGSRPSPADFADAERIDAATQDPRSAIGTASRNLSLDANYASSPLLRRSAAQSLAGLQEGVQQSGAQATQAQDGLAQTAAQGANELAAENLRGQFGLANTNMELQKAQLQREQHPITNADGSISLLNLNNGVATPAKNADGSPVKVLMPKDDANTKRTNEMMDGISKTAGELAKNWIPPAGSPSDAQPPIAQLRENAARLAGARIGTDPRTGQRVAMINGQVMPL